MLEAQRTFLARCRAACERDRAAHPHQLLALEREAALAADAADVHGYLAASGNVLELARAEALDAAWNRLRVAQAVRDRWLERAAATEYVHAVLQQWPAPAPAASPGALFTRALLLAFEARAGGLEDAHEHLAGAVRELHAADPGFDPARPEYAQRLPWRELPAWLPRGPGAQEEPLPDVAAAARAWRARLREPAPAVEPVEIDPAAPRPPAPEELARAAAAPLRARSVQSIERQADWPDPLVERHHRELIGALDAAGTRTEVALAAAHADACLAIESDWNALLHAPLVAPLRAMCGGADPAAAASLARALLGADPRTLRRAGELLARATALAREDEVTLGAQAGEAGFELLADLRRHLSAGGAAPVLEAASADFPIDLPKRPVLSSEPRL